MDYNIDNKSQKQDKGELEMNCRNQKLKSLRFDYGLTQDDMAKILGISRSTYNEKENGFSEFKQSEIFWNQRHENRTKQRAS